MESPASTEREISLELNEFEMKGFAESWKLHLEDEDRDTGRFNWEEGTFLFDIDIALDVRGVVAYNVQFSKDDIDRLLPAETNPKDGRINSGPRRSDKWEDWTIEFMSALYRGDITEKSSASEVEELVRGAIPASRVLGEATTIELTRKILNRLRLGVQKGGSSSE